MPLDPILEPILEAMNAAEPLPDNLTIAEQRAQLHEMMDMSFVALGDDPEPVANVEDLRVAVADG